MSDASSDQGAEESVKEKKPLSMSAKILIGLLLGIAVGLFFGEIVAPFKYAGDAYVGLIQMTVLPYIILSLIGGIGKLTARQSRLLITRVAVIILALWVIGLLAVLMFGLALPAQTSASFFSVSMIEAPKSFDYFELFIPSNPFKSMAEAKVPAIVVFCVLTGAAIIGMKDKDGLLGGISKLKDVMGRVTDFIVDLSHYGVFFIAAAAAGTMDLEELGRIQGYLVILTVITALLCFGLIPALIGVFTPIRYKDISSLLRGVFILAFATGKTLVVLPMLIEGIRKIFDERDIKNEEATSTIDILVPLAYSFPHLGRILSSAFIPFAAWYIGSPLLVDQYPLLLGASTVAHFSNSPASIPFLLDLMQLPSDLFQLFVFTSVYVGRVTDAVGAAYILAVTIFGTCVISGHFKVNWAKLGALSAITVAVSIVTVIGSRAYLTATSSGEYTKDQIVATMQVLDRNVESQYVERGPNPVPLIEGDSRLERIIERGVMRVGYIGDNLPFVYSNSEDKLVGFDVEMIDHLAHEIGVSIEYVPFSAVSEIAEDFANDFYDIAIGGIADTIQRSRMYPATEPYFFMTMALVVPDYRDSEFAHVDKIAEMDSVKIAIISKDWFIESMRFQIPHATLVEVDSPRDFFEGRADGADALLYGAEAGSAWSLLYPRFQVVTPFRTHISIPLVMPYGGFKDTEMDEFLDNWVMLSRYDGAYEEAYNYWILGEGTEVREPRWSVIRDVLHWVD